MTGRNSARTRKTAPVLEALEGRQLLNARVIAPGGYEINDKDLARYQVQKQNNVPLNDRRINYTTPDGTKVQLTLFGFGSLNGTTVRPDGTLDLVYSKTTSTTKIVGHTERGTGRAPLGSIRALTSAVGSPSATGTTPINVVNLKHFDLVQGGFINIEGGVGTLALASAGPNTQIHISPLPQSSTSSSSSNATTTTQAAVSTNTGAIASTTGQSVIVTSNATNTTTAPTGAQVFIPVVRAAPRTVALGNAQIFGFDPAASALVRFDAVTGAALQSIPVAAGGTPLAGVGLARDNGRLVALVGSGTTISAYDTVTGGLVGQFSTAGLATRGLTRVDGVGSSDTRTFVSDASAGPNGLIQSLDVTASLRTGQAVPIGIPFAPQREFELNGGLTGLAGSDTIYASGGAHFDTFTPDRVELGILAFTPSATLGARETNRLAVPGVLTSTIDLGPTGSARANPTAALGSIGGSLALDTAVIGGKNVVTLYTPTTTSTTTSLVTSGVVALNDPNRLAGLSESFHPELVNGALLDVTGNLRTFVATKATGLVVNSSGAVNLVQIKSATDTAIVGRPLNHVNIPRRNNVTLISSARGPNGVSTKNGVTLQKTALPIGVLTLP